MNPFVVGRHSLRIDADQCCSDGAAASPIVNDDVNGKQNNKNELKIIQRRNKYEEN